jgi:hypothetical protein
MRMRTRSAGLDSYRLRPPSGEPWAGEGKAGDLVGKRRREQSVVGFGFYGRRRGATHRGDDGRGKTPHGTGGFALIGLLGGSAHVRGDWQQTVELESVSRCSHLGRLFGFCLDQVSASAQRSKSESGSRAV